MTGAVYAFESEKLNGKSLDRPPRGEGPGKRPAKPRGPAREVGRVRHEPSRPLTMLQVRLKPLHLEGRNILPRDSGKAGGLTTRNDSLST